MSAVTALIGFVFSRDAWSTLSDLGSWPLWGVVISSLIYQTMLTMQYRALSASLATILNQSGIAWSMMYDIVLFSKIPSYVEIMVAVFVFCGLMIMQDWPRRIYAQRRRIMRRR
jgi:drug/metabolite transporter (DMT)-like permease